MGLSLTASVPHFVKEAFMGVPRVLIGLLAAALLAGVPARGADDSERARIEKEVMAKVAEGQTRAADEAISNRMNELLSDGAVQILGNPSGDVVIIEFFDYQCPYTKAVQPRLA